MRLDLDTEDRYDRYRAAMDAVMDLIDGQDHNMGVIKASSFGCLMHLLHDELDRTIITGGRPPRAVNDLDVD